MDTVITAGFECPADRERRTAAPPLRAVLICNYDVFNAATVCDHINALTRYTRHHIFPLSRIGEIPEDFPLESFDAVIIHYSIFIAIETYLGPKTRHRLAAFPGLKALFIQDEYRFVERTIAMIRRLGVSLVFTCIESSEWTKVYPAEKLPGVRFEKVLTGYVPFFLTIERPLPFRQRSVDVGYRGREYPYWHGPAGRQKLDVGKRFLKDARRYRLRCDIRFREKDRLYGRAWVDFLRRCRAVLAVESGASVFDFDGTISSKVEIVSALRGKQFTYEDARLSYFAGMEDKIDLYQISPRVFEAAALGTLLIMYEGRYSGIFKPWRHYIPLKHDHSNMDEVVRALRSDERCAEIVANAFAEIALNPAYSYEALVQRVDTLLDEESVDRERREAPFEFEELREKYPFYLIENPHGISLPRTRTLRVYARRFLRRTRRRA